MVDQVLSVSQSASQSLTKTTSIEVSVVDGKFSVVNQSVSQIVIKAKPLTSAWQMVNWV